MPRHGDNYWLERIAGYTSGGGGTGTTAQQVQGNSAAGASTLQGNPVRMGGIYKATPATRTDGQTADLTTDVNENLKVTMATGLSGEDLQNDVLKVEQRFGYKNITSQTTTVVKSGVGMLHSINFNTPLASGVATIYDGVDTSGTKIGTITFPAVLLTDVTTFTYNVAFSVGLTIVTSGATQDITVSYR